MKHSYRFNELKSELVQVGCIKREKQRLTFLAGTTAVERLSAELKKRLLSVKELKQITLLDTDSIEWSLILGSGYNVSQAAARGKLTKLCCTVINETNERDMRSRAKLLRLTCAASLRSSLWFDINRWLLLNPSGLPSGRPQFQYWDRLTDQPPSEVKFYMGDKAEKIEQLLCQDIKRLEGLGDFLTSCAALCNNPESSVKDRVISSEVRDAIDSLLRVGKTNLLIPR